MNPNAVVYSRSVHANTARILVLFCFMVIAPAIKLPAQDQARQSPVDGLIFDLKSPDPLRRKEAAKQLGDKRAQQAVPNLVVAASDVDPAVRREVAIALDKMLDPRTIPGLVPLTNDADQDIRERAMQGILDIYLPREGGVGATVNKVANFLNPWSDEWADVVAEPGVPVDPSAVTALQQRLQDTEEGIRIKAARALGVLRGKAAIPAMLDSLNQDRSNTVRFELIRALRKTGDPSVAKDLMNYVSYSDSKIRSEAVFTLGRLRYREAVPELTRLYERESAQPAKMIDKTYRERLLDALAFIGDAASKDLFAKEQTNSDDLLRLHAVEGLARIGDPSLVTDISRNRLHEKDAKIQTAQAYALYKMGRKEYLDALVKALSNRKTRDGARQYLVEFRPDQLPELYAHVKSNDVGVREGLAEVFGLIGDSESIQPLQELSKDRRGQIATLANQAIRRINARTAGQ